MENLTENSRTPLDRGTKRIAAAGGSFATLFLAAGCSRAPSFNILGSFFPAWIGCGIAGILLAVAVRLFFLRIKLEEKMRCPKTTQMCRASVSAGLSVLPSLQPP
jgi:hypothetical protein